MRVNNCPCCGDALLRHARRKGVYWFCTSCRQEMMPLISDRIPLSLDTQPKPRVRTLQSVKS